MASKLILLVEDDLNLRQSTMLVLLRAGYQVTATDCVPEALEIASYGKCSLVILDGDMPGTKNILLPRLQQEHPTIPIIILRDQSQPGSELYDEDSPEYFLIKPAAPETLLKCIKMVLE